MAKTPKTDKPPKSASSLGAAFALGKTKAKADAEFRGWRQQGGIIAGAWNDGTTVYKEGRKIWLA